MTTGRGLRRSWIPLAALLAAAPARGQEPGAFTLDITRKTIEETNWGAALSAVAESEGVRVEAGAAITAGRIGLTLSGVRGHGRFVASIERVRAVLGNRAPATDPPRRR